MRQRIRKSSASLSVVALSTEGRRPSPPAYLDASAPKLWKAIVTDSPSGWFTVAQEPLLAGFCSHASTAEFFSMLIENERPADCSAIATSCAATTRLLGMRARETAALSALATKMRLTQQSQIQPRSAGRTWSDHSPGPKLWDRKPPWENQ